MTSREPWPEPSGQGSSIKLVLPIGAVSMQDYPTPMTPEISRLDIGNVSLAWKRFGHDAPLPVLFLHGLGDSAIMTFERIALHPALEGREAILVDLPGFGYSTAPDDWPGTIESHADAMLALLDALGLPRVTIVGHSMGASLALVVAVRQPQRVNSLILAEPLLKREHSELARVIAKRQADQFTERGYAMLLLATTRQARRGDKAAQGFLEPLKRANPAILYRGAVSLLADRSPSFLEALGMLEIPRTLLVGERTDVDLSIVPDDVPIVRIPDAGHSMMSENPEGFARAIAEHLPG